MTETLFAFWLALALCLLATAVRRRAWRRAAVSGPVLGVAALARPVSLYLIPLWAAGALLALRTSSERRRAVTLTLVMPAFARPAPGPHRGFEGMG
jgi:4-amino-4-deoxy-L-arabinose transferase-like glycosyltransferase